MTIVFDENGLAIPTQQEIRDDLAERLRGRFGPNLKTEQPGVMPQIIDIMTELRADDHQALLAVYRSFDPNAAVKRQLDARLGLTGSTREDATRSVVDGTLTFSSAGMMNNGDKIQNDDNQTIWELTDGPHTSAGPWPETIAAQFTAVDTGPILANAGTTWSAVTVVAGLDGFTNPTDDAEPGQDEERDGDARRRRLIELNSQGQGPLDPIRGAVSKAEVNGTRFVEFVRVYHNPETQPVDAEGIPFKAFNVVVQTNPPTPTADQQQAIFDAIWASMGAGGHAYGTDFTGTVTDSEGQAQPVAFDTVTELDVVLEIDLVTSTSEDAITPNIESVVATQVLAVAQADFEDVGRDVRALDFTGIVDAMLKAGTISGVDAVNVRMAISPAGPTAVAKLSLGAREKADFDSTNITVIQA